MKTRYALLATAAMGLLLETTPALAQEAASTQAYVDQGDIVVSARKRQESIMNVPVVTNTLDQRQLEKFQTDDISKVAEQVPGLVVGEGAAAAYGAQISLRGVGTSVLNGTVDQSVSLNVDSQQFTQGLAYTAAMFDIGQITVLKGPQALFFGKASPGGVIAIQTADPTPDFEARVRAGYEFVADAKQGEVIVSGPLSDTLGLRLAGRYTRTLGYFRNRAEPIPGLGGIMPKPRRGTNSSEGIVRGTALWQPTDRFTARLKVTYTQNNVDGKSGQFTSCPDGITGPGGVPFIGNPDCKLDRNFGSVDLDPASFNGIKRGGHQFSDIEQTFGVLELNYDFTDALKLTSVTGYYDVNEQDQFNASSSNGAGPPFSSYTHYNRNDFTQELRLTSDFRDSPVNFTLGAFYQKVKQHKLGIALGNAALRLPAYFSNGTHSNPEESESLFGQVLWKVTPTLEIAGGARWTHEDRRHVYINLLTSPDPVALAVPQLKSNRVSPELTVTFTPTEDLTIFGALKKGYKSGSFNSSGSFRPGDDSSFHDEKVKGGEMGLKARFLDRALSFNLSGYYYEYGDLQVGANSQQDTGLIVVRTLNAASAKIYGVEMDSSYRPPSIEGLTVRMAASWNHARYGKFTNAPCWGGQTAAQGCNQLFARNANQTPPGPAGAVQVNGVYGFYTSQDLSGRELLRSPDFTATAGFDYEQPIGGGMKLLFASQMRYSSKYFADILLRDNELQPAYAKVNANVTLYGPDERWELSLIANNLTDHLIRNRCSSSNAANGLVLGGIITGGIARGAAGVDEVICTVDPGREVWVRAAFRF
ncbi:TonB-dependent receptor [Novosphingobium album (ex Liu et al. 2023)]|uniref:TonB-dependent receptor n=1 Tax=Novosphingobium album (ex Liu et al. 2023) TaxID=3031130 RepID=A0ABT5WUK5_9SPHN|nr:TonB-dependent receptor [Novosphingobium album (ex Liu et al. 2023)]MDE8653563.1 TonB-dependent receptor [Novosphingobium album (ex Liu et al. 2023)]